MRQLVALLRGINVGPHKRIAMADLRELLSDMGYDDVRTHLQSGNVVFAARGSPATAARAIERQIEKRLDLLVDVVIRTGDELEDIVAANPLDDVADDPAKLQVVFLSRKPTAAALKKLEQEDFSPERVVVRGSEVYAWCPDGVRDSALMKALAGKRLAPVATARNWRTVTKLRDMVHDG